MKLGFNRRCCLVLLLAASCSMQLIAAGEFTKTIKKEYDIIATGTTAISNKYGKVEIKTWDKNRVKIEVQIIVKAGSESIAQGIFDRINVSFNASSNYVKAETTIGTSYGRWWGSDKTEYKINYLVTAPPTNNFEINNQYGDVFIDEVKSNVDLAVKYGNFNLASIEGEAFLDVAYGKGSLAKGKKVVCEVSYGGFNCDEAKEIEVTSGYSQMIFGIADRVKSNSKYDSYRINQIRYFENNGKYDNIQIEKVEEAQMIGSYSNLVVSDLAKNLNCNLKYGSARVDRVGREFSEVILIGSHCNFTVGVLSGTDYKLDAIASHAGIKYPNDLEIVFEKDANTSHEVRGFSGNSNAPRIIKGQLNYGGLKVLRN